MLFERRDFPHRFACVLLSLHDRSSFENIKQQASRQILYELSGHILCVCWCVHLGWDFSSIIVWHGLLTDVFSHLHCNFADKQRRTWLWFYGSWAAATNATAPTILNLMPHRTYTAYNTAYAYVNRVTPVARMPTTNSCSAACVKQFI